MKKLDIITLNDTSSAIKYRQIVNAVTDAIQEGKLKSGDKLPSINEVCKKWSLSRDTVQIAYNELKSRGIVTSFPGKGYYIENSNIRLTHNIFVLFDELNSFKEDLYNSFLDNLSKSTKVDIYFHHFNRKLFDQLIDEAKGHYTAYVIMPAKFKNTLQQLQILNGRVIILDQLPSDLKGHFPAIYQNFREDTYNALMSGKTLIEKYQSIIMVYPGGKEPEDQYKGFMKFCKDADLEHELISDLQDREIKKGEVYIAIWDRDLVWLIRECRKKGLLPGKDIGIISYNDAALKEIVGEGITTISTDFKQMGCTLAGLATNKSAVRQIQNPSSLIIRGSL
jgi:DNA-binding transcriptional regulator YhcF (GntR family)